MILNLHRPKPFSHCCGFACGRKLSPFIDTMGIIPFPILRQKREEKSANPATTTRHATPTSSRENVIHTLLTHDISRFFPYNFTLTTNSK
jgi:hypothetical protein